MSMVHGRVVLVQSDGMSDWYAIERAEHEHRGGMELVEGVPGIPDHMAFVWSGRVCDADVEGTSAEMLAIAEAIERGESVSFKRCSAVVRDDGGYALSSPRNSMRVGIITADQARQLAASIREVVGAHRE